MNDSNSNFQHFLPENNFENVTQKIILENLHDLNIYLKFRIENILIIMLTTISDGYNFKFVFGKTFLFSRSTSPFWNTI